MFLYRWPHLYPCWGCRLSTVLSRDFVLLCGGLTLSSSQTPVQMLSHSSSPQAAWKYLLHHGPHPGLQGSLCSGTWSTKVSNSPSLVEPPTPSHRANKRGVGTACGPHTLKQELKFSSLFSGTTLNNLSYSMQSVLVGIASYYVHG